MNEKSTFCQYCKRNGSRDDCIDCSAQFDPAGKRISPPSNYVPNSSDNPVEHPSHYTFGGIECIDAIKASMTADGFCDYCKGNIMKYIWRWRSKGGVEDLKKARVYLDWMIQSADGEESEDE